VDVPNSLDHLWVLDIKKSSASPPRELREALKTLATQFIAPSTRVQRFRGRRQKDQDQVTRMWDVFVDRDTFRYQINRDHPVVRGFADSLDATQLAPLEILVEAIEQSFPVLDAHNRLGDDAMLGHPQDAVQASVANAVRIRPMFADTHPGTDDFVAMLEGIEPYSQVDGFAAALRTALAES
jgi:hypothetical protein